MKKRILCLLLAAVFMTATSCSGKTPAANSNNSAESTAEKENPSDDADSCEKPDTETADTENTDDKNVLDFPDEGTKLILTDDFDNIKGVFDYYESDFLADEYGVYFVSFTYVGTSKEDSDAFMEKDDATDDEINAYYEKSRGLGNIFGVKDADTPEKASEILLSTLEDYSQDAADLYKPESLKEVGKVNDITYYYYLDPDDSSPEGLDDGFKEEYRTLISSMEEIITNGEFYEPVPKFTELIGKKLSFETTDLDGNTIKSEEIFAENDVTMLNVWATWCGPCVNELPELKKINKRLADKNCAIVGVLGDKEDDTDEGKRIIKDSGVTYLNILPWDTFDDDLDMSDGWPTSFFVDSKGTIVGNPTVGAYTDAYEKKIDEILDAENSDDASGSTIDKGNGKNAYRIIVKDEKDSPIEGVTIQFCSDEACFMDKTGADGVASFDNEPGEYTIHILAVPDGFEKDSTEYKTPDVYSDVRIILNRS